MGKELDLLQMMQEGTPGRADECFQEKDVSLVERQMLRLQEHPRGTVVTRQ